MRTSPEKHAIGRAPFSDSNHLEITATDGLPDVRDLHVRGTTDRREHAIEVGQPVWFAPRHVQPRAWHNYCEPDAILRQALGRDGFPVAAVFGDDERLELAGPRAGRSVPNNIQSPELERELRPCSAVEPQMNVPCRAVRRGPFVIGEQVNLDRTLRITFVPGGGSVFEAGVD